MITIIPDPTELPEPAPEPAEQPAPVLGSPRYAIEALSALARNPRNPMRHDLAATMIDFIKADR